MKNNSKRGPKIVSKSHPRGSQGTKVSISEIVKRVEKGRMDPKTRAWSIETIQRGNLGGFGADKMQQAKALLDRLRKERTYIEDPVDGEFMQSSACTLDGCDGLIFLGGDCDDMVIAFLSAIESVGIEGALVAHSYENHREHTHVLAAVRDDKRSKWVRCDPSTSDPFGTVNKPTRETFYGIPGGKVLADRNGAVDVSKVGSALGNIRPTGDFVGVGKPFASGSVGEGEQAEPVMGEVSEAFYAYMVKEVVRVTDLLEQAWFSLKYNHEQLRYACQMMNDMNGGGYELVGPDHAETGEGSGSKLPVWTKEKEAQYQAFQTWMPVLISYGRDVETGKKKVAWDPTVGDEGDVVILGVPGDVYIGVTQNGQLQVVTLAEPGNVGGWLVVAGLVVATVAVIAGAVAVLNSANNLVKANMVEREQKFAADMTEKYGLEKGMEIVREVNEGAKARADAEVEREKVSPFAKISETAESAASALIAIGIGAAAIYALTVAVDWSKTRKAKA